MQRIILRQSGERWWQKPLASAGGRPLPAELVVLRRQLREGEGGAWLNSRSTKTGVADLRRDPSGKFVTVRIPLPDFVTRQLDTLYKTTRLAKGAPDLVIWQLSSHSVRFVEVKCPHWDSPSAEQQVFLTEAARHGSPSSIVEWEFGIPPEDAV